MDHEGIRDTRKTSTRSTQKGETFFGIHAKPGITKLNIASIFFIRFFTILVSDDYISLQQPLMINKKYFNLSREEATAMQSQATSLTTVPAIIMTFASGYIFDIFGRRNTLSILFIISGCMFVIFPLVAPDKDVYYVVACLFTLMITPINNNPLVQDYVQVESRGTAVSLSMMGLALGIIVSLSVLFQLTKNLDPVVSWGIMTVIQVSFGIGVFFMI